MIKTCFKCGIEKSLDDFYRHNEMSDGHLNKCKECSKKDNKVSNGVHKRNCLKCSKDFRTTAGEIKKGGGKFCSRSCWRLWFQGKNIYNFKGESAGYTAKHHWISKTFGTPIFCEICKTSKVQRYEWSNISGKYKKDIRDWQRLCVKCHRNYDKSETIVECIVCKLERKTFSKKMKFCSKRCSTRYYRSKKV